MANRTFSPNTSCSEHGNKSPVQVPVESSRSGHVLKVYADFAIFDTNTGDFVDPSLVVNEFGKRGLRQ